MCDEGGEPESDEHVRLFDSVFEVATKALRRLTDTTQALHQMNDETKVLVSAQDAGHGVIDSVRGRGLILEGTLKEHEVAMEKVCLQITRLVHARPST